MSPIFLKIILVHSNDEICVLDTSCIFAHPEGGLTSDVNMVASVTQVQPTQSDSYLALSFCPRASLTPLVDIPMCVTQKCERSSVLERNPCPEWEEASQ